MARSNVTGRVRYKKPDGSFGLMGRRKYKMMQDAKRRAAQQKKSAPKTKKEETASQVQNLLSEMGITDQAQNQLAANANPPIRVSNPNTFFGGNPAPAAPVVPAAPAPPVQQPMLNPGTIQGSMGMTPVNQPVPEPQAPAQEPATLRQTVQQQQFAKQQQGGAAGAAAGGAPSATNTPSPGGVNNNIGATANTTPAISPTSAGTIQFGTGPLSGGVTTEQLQNTVTGSPTLNAPPISSQQIFQAQFNPLINSPGQADIMNQLSMAGRSNVAGQYGTGGFADVLNQQAVNQGTMQGIQAAQQLAGENLKHGLGAEQIGSQFDMARRQQHVQHLGQMLQPAIAGAASGYGAGLQGNIGLPNFLG